jgi:hypothetical protein
MQLRLLPQLLLQLLLQWPMSAATYQHQHQPLGAGRHCCAFFASLSHLSVQLAAAHHLCCVWHSWAGYQLL